MTTITTISGDTVDLICRRHFGDESGFVEAVYEANRGLAAHGPYLPIGLTILLPDVAVAPGADRIVRLWE